jgi:hypothetical protein
VGNPFTPSFGSEPLFLAGRSLMIDDVLEGLGNRPGDPNRSTLFVGPRGSGKTVLLAKVADMAQSQGWVAARVTAAPGMAERLLERIRGAGEEFLTPTSKTQVTGVTVHGIGVSRQGIPETSTWGHRFTQLVEELNSRSVGLVIAVDEVSADSPDLVALAAEYQQMVTDKRDVALLMAGLPGKVSQLLRSDAASFLRRAFQRRLDLVTAQEAAEAIDRTLEASGRTIERRALAAAAAATEGYPFLIQLVGYHLWRLAHASAAAGMRDVERAVLAARNDMDHMILETTIQELSKRDVEFLLAMAQDPIESSVRDIAARMGASASLVSKYRRRLLEQGVIGDLGRGRLRFELPMLRRYVAERFSV